MLSNTSGLVEFRVSLSYGYNFFKRFPCYVTVWRLERQSSLSEIGN